MTKRHIKYNPSFLSEKELLENFVVRQSDLDLMMGIISENVTNSNQHALIVGPRGIGNTTLVHRVAAEIKQNKEFINKWYPLIFSEESYEVVSAGEFWLEALFHLSEQTGDEKWRRTYAELKSETNDQRLLERALAQLLDFSDSQGKRILLIVENLNMLLGDLVGDEDAWKIRHTLMNEPRIMLLATAISRFEHFENSSKAMFEMFKVHELKPLDEDECNRVWESITEHKLPGERIKPIRILTGGNPRLLTIIAKFGAHRSFRRLLDDLVDLIDDHTEYFKSHLDNLPVTERKVYLALAGLWDASTAREIAAAARLDVSKTSALLGRLMGRGAVMVDARGKKIKWYVVTERLYNIYYLMRRRGKPADRVKATVKFMISMYDVESAARLITEEASSLSPEICRDHYLAYEEVIREIPDRQLLDKIISSTPKNFLETPYVSETLRSINILGQAIEIKEENNHIEINELKEAAKSLKNAINLLNEVKNSQEIELFEKIIKIFEGVITRFSSSEEESLVVYLAVALVGKGISLSYLNRAEEAIAVYDEVAARFSDAEEPILREFYIHSVFRKAILLDSLSRFQEAETLYGKVIELNPDFTEPHVRLISLLLKLPGRTNDALHIAENFISLKPQDSMLLSSIARAFYRHGDLSLLPKVEHWARLAVSISPEDAKIHHTLACILSALGKGGDAFEHARKYIQDVPFVEGSIEDAIELFVEMAASGHPKEALEILLESEAKKHLEPLVVGLKMCLGEDVKTAPEIREVAKDVVKRIEMKGRQRKG
jgi:tetratricopeptide (TPR) repeat protein